MKREQIEKIARAMVSLLGAVEGAGSISVTRTEYGRSVTFWPETDEDVAALC